MSRNYEPGQRYYRQRNYRRRFVNMKNNGRNSRLINNTNTIDRIVRINTPQITNNSLSNNFLNGTSFYDNNNSFESLILPAGFSTSLFS